MERDDFWFLATILFLGVFVVAAFAVLSWGVEPVRWGY